MPTAIQNMFSKLHWPAERFVPMNLKWLFTIVGDRNYWKQRIPISSGGVKDNTQVHTFTTCVLVNINALDLLHWLSNQLFINQYPNNLNISLNQDIDFSSPKSNSRFIASEICKISFLMLIYGFWFKYNIFYTKNQIGILLNFC